jgi:hypothetical protein
LEWLKNQLAHEQAKWEGYTGNNPGKWASIRRSLEREITRVSDDLKDRGLLARSPTETLKRALDRQTPSRMKGCCTKLEGQWYRIRFTGKNGGGFWEWEWDAVSPDVVDGPGSYVHPASKENKGDVAN